MLEFKSGHVRMGRLLYKCREICWGVDTVKVPYIYYCEGTEAGTIYAVYTRFIPIHSRRIHQHLSFFFFFHSIDIHIQSSKVPLVFHPLIHINYFYITFQTTFLLFLVMDLQIFIVHPPQIYAHPSSCFTGLSHPSTLIPLSPQ